jgi:hypothetical protein
MAHSGDAAREAKKEKFSWRRAEMTGRKAELSLLDIFEGQLR